VRFSVHGSILQSTEDQNGIDVVVIGGGLAGLATSIHLARAGLSVTCVRSDELSSDPVGESLDWSAPDLLKGIGLPIDTLVRRGIATTKQHVTLQLLEGSERHYVPGAWLAEFPFNVRLDTIHVDREALAQVIRDLAERERVQVISDQVTGIEHKARRILSVTTKQGQQLHAKWFVDASGGTTRLFARTFSLPAREYGPTKVAVWDYFPVPGLSVEGTTLYGSPSSATYMDWIWQIPIRPGMVSVGCVTTGEAMKQRRQSGLNVQQIYEARLKEFPALASLLPRKEPIAPRVTSFRCRVHKGVSGPNWLIVGEAASMVDPMTANGVTAALRHAQEAAALLISNRNASRLPRLASAAYAWRVRDVAAFFNSLIETIIYEKNIRAHVGMLVAGDVYTIPAWLMNFFYSRTRPSGVIGSACFGMVLRFLRCSAAAFSWFCRVGGPTPARLKN
jgi:flavin-dependent dehydrogenase